MEKLLKDVKVGDICWFYSDEFGSEIMRPMPLKLKEIRYIYKNENKFVDEDVVRYVFENILSNYEFSEDFSYRYLEYESWHSNFYMRGKIYADDKALIKMFNDKMNICTHCINAINSYGK